MTDTRAHSTTSERHALLTVAQELGCVKNGKAVKFETHFQFVKRHLTSAWQSLAHDVYLVERKKEVRTTNARTKQQIVSDRAAILRAVKKGSKHESFNGVNAYDVAEATGQRVEIVRRDLQALAKKNEITCHVESRYDSVSNSHGLFGGAVAVKRKMARYTA